MDKNSIIKNRILLVGALYKAIHYIQSSKEHKQDILDNLNEMRTILATIKDDTKEHFVAFSTEEDFKISYARTKDDLFNSNKRIKLTFAKYVRRQLENTKISDSALDALTNVAFAFNGSDVLGKDIKYFRGEDIVTFYNSIDKTNHSCMTSNCDCHKTNFYAINPDKVSIITFKDTLRALLWNCDDGIKILDRIYPESHKFIPMLKMWAVTNGVLYRKVLDRPDSTSNVELSDGKQHKITMKNSYIFPYLDTFREGWIQGDTIVLSNNNTIGNATFVETNGGYCRKRCCEKCGIRGNNMQFYNGLEYCQSCLPYKQKTCTNCGKYLSQEEAESKHEYCVECFNKQIAFVALNNCGCNYCIDNKKRAEHVILNSKRGKYKDFNTVSDIVASFKETLFPKKTNVKTDEQISIVKKETKVVAAVITDANTGVEEALDAPL